MLCTTQHYQLSGTVPYFTTLHYTTLHYNSVQGSILNYNEFYIPFWAFRYNSGKVMAKQTIFTFGFITLAVFVATKGNSFNSIIYSIKKLHYECILSCLPNGGETNLQFSEYKIVLLNFSIYISYILTCQRQYVTFF